MPSAIPIKCVSIRHLDSNREKSRKFKKADVFLQSAFRQSLFHETTSCKASASDSWRHWDTAIPIHDFDGFTVQVVQNRIFPFQEKVLGRVDVDCTSFAVVDSGATCVLQSSRIPSHFLVSTLKQPIHCHRKLNTPKIRHWDVQWAKKYTGNLLYPRAFPWKIQFALGEISDHIDLAHIVILVVEKSAGPISTNTPLQELHSKVDSARKSEFVSESCKWVEKFEKSQRYMEGVMSLVEGFADIMKDQVELDVKVRDLVSSMEKMLSVLDALEG
ncbi:hypothetical protein A0H81_01601 [Grifola frondosa]|uniref:Uncharacterized protein n=1 Tax=Grifola frondosa TaxID=5627 RepID=A0A1C7MNK1_GRIFR|nr:hypothetical protein A0H81_01601 [Grifola frondosa]